jgi:hypothetical protein
MSIFSDLADQAESRVKRSDHFGVMSKEGYKYSSYKKFGLSIVDICSQIVMQGTDEPVQTETLNIILKERQRIKDEILKFFGVESHE